MARCAATLASCRMPFQECKASDAWLWYLGQQGGLQE